MESNENNKGNSMKNQEEGSYRKIDILVTFCTILPLIFIIWATPTYAKETIDLQDYTDCDMFGNCITEVDINELDLSKDGKDLLKSIKKDTPYDLNSSLDMVNFDISVKEEKLIIKGKVRGNTYWLADFGSVMLDPWWNTSYPYCLELAVEDGVANYRAFLNLSYKGNMTNGNFSGLWFVNATCNETGSVMPHFLRDYVNGSWGTFDLVLDGTQNISVYYGNESDIVNHSSLADVWYNPLLYTPHDENTGASLLDHSVYSGFTHGTIDGAEWGSGFHAYSLLYDRGDTDWTAFGDTNDVGEISLLAWVYPTEYTGSNEYHILSKTTSGAVGSWVFGIYGNGSLRFDIRQVGGFCGAIYGGTPVPLEEWSLVGATYEDNGEMYVYLDGSIDGSGSCSLGAGSIDGSSSTLYEGALATTTHNFAGGIDEVKLWNYTWNYTAFGWLYTDPEPNIVEGNEWEYVPEGGEPEPEENETFVNATNTSYVICYDNMTLYEHDYFFNMNGTPFLNETYYHCVNGCDNITFSCEYPDYVEDFYVFIIVIAFFVGLAVLIKYVRRF